MAYTWPVTLAEAHSQLNIAATDTSNDAEIQGFIDAATTVIENVVGPVTGTQYTEWVNGGGPAIVLRYYPVVSVSTVTEYADPSTGNTLTAEPLGTPTYSDTGYRVQTDTGVLTRTSGGLPVPFAPGTGNIQVVYTAGQATVPANVRLAALELIQHLWNRSQVGPAATFGVPGAAEPGMATVAGYAVPNAVLELLEPHRKAPRVG